MWTCSSKFCPARFSSSLAIPLPGASSSAALEPLSVIGCLLSAETRSTDCADCADSADGCEQRRLRSLGSAEHYCPTGPARAVRMSFSREAEDNGTGHLGQARAGVRGAPHRIDRGLPETPHLLGNGRRQAGATVRRETPCSRRSMCPPRSTLSSQPTQVY